MKARSRFLCEHSLGMALSAIEVYNKPDFKEREQVFAVLMVGAWESLLKARILQQSRNRLTAIYVKEGREYKRKKGGEHWTISVHEALRRCGLSPVVIENVERLVDIRDAAIHLTAASPALPSLVFALGSAALKNYARLIRQWFDVGLGDYSFYILPLGFQYPFQTLSVADAKREPSSVAKVLAEVARAQHENRAADGDFLLVCEIETTLVSAKKITESTDLVAEITGDATDQLVVERRVRPIDQYPLTFTDLWEKLRAARPGVKQHDVHRLIREHRVKANPDLATYNFRSKTEERRGPSAGTPVIYNHDALRFLLSQLE